jgi:hypothetical protein
MSTLVMVLTAAMVVPGDGPERLSWEIEQGLDLSGEWEGIWWFHTDGQLQVTSRGSRLVGTRKPGVDGWVGSSIDTCNFIDDSHGKLSGTWDLSGAEIRGIYRQDGERLILCFSKAPHSRPTSFEVGGNQHLLLLHRVKPRK